MQRLCALRVGIGPAWNGFEVVDCSYQPVGTLLSLWYHEKGDAIQFFGIQIVDAAGKGSVVPAEDVQVDATHRWVRLPYPRAIVEDGPAYPLGAEFTLEEEREIYLHYDVRVTAYPPAGAQGHWL